jgi:glycerol-3-phosphate dehydrogenase (NAD(P)+)
MPASSPILVLGAGAWGTTLALVLSRNSSNEVFLWGRNADVMASMLRTRVNEKYLPGVSLPPALNLIAGRDFPSHTSIVVVAVPFQTLRGVLESFVVTMGAPDCIACACKGIEKSTFLRADQIVASVCPSTTIFAMLSGPNFAQEVAAERPSAITIATQDEVWGRELVRRFHSPVFRPYITTDVIGVEIGGAIKNVMAIAAGICDGLELGANSRAALITRGLAEISRFGVAQGGKTQTFMGLSGLGDLVLTCTDDKSRNRRFGLQLAAGLKVEDAVAKIGLVEGATTATALVALAEQLQIDMPISGEVAATIAGRTTPKQAVLNLLARNPVAESVGLTPSD